MAVRKRFTPAERSALVPGARVEWLNGSHWQPAIITTGPHTDSIGSWRVTARHDGPTSRTISHGARIDPGPGGVRLAVITEGA